MDEKLSQSFNTELRNTQYNVSSIPFHTHSGIDSPKINLVHIVTEQLNGTEAATSANYSVFFTAPFSMQVIMINEVHQTKGTVGSPTLNIEKLTGTQASGAGVNLLATAFDLTGNNNTVQYGVLDNTKNQQTFKLAKGDRLGLVSSGTLTSLANVIVTVTLNF